MSSQSSQNIPPASDSPPTTGGVRRHHTISAASRTARASAKETISEENQNPELWNDDEVVGEDWVGGVGAVGEKSSLHRQASLPTKYHRGLLCLSLGSILMVVVFSFPAFQNSGTKSGSMTPKTMNSLTAIAGHEGDEEEWEKEIGGYVVPEEEASHFCLSLILSTQHAPDPNEPVYGQSTQDPSPPPAASSVRRHVSLTYGAQGAGVNRPKVTSLKRAGTLQTPLPPNNTVENVGTGASEEEYEYTYTNEDPAAYDTYDTYATGGPTSPLGRSSPWGSTGSSSGSGGDWRAPGGLAQAGNNAIDDVQRALSSMEISGSGASGSFGQSAHPPRFNPTHPGPTQAPGIRGGNGNGNNKHDYDGRKTPTSQGQYNSSGGNDTLTGRISNPNLQYAYNQHHKNSSGGSAGSVERIPNVPPIPSQYLQQNQQQQLQNNQQTRLGVATSFVGGQSQQGNRDLTGQNAPQAFEGPLDVSSLIATKGYNPSTFDIRPDFARYFVIKSYTEDDVHKSLKYEIWSSTDPGNKRLDKAFKDCNGRGPIYLFFSVNASGHFCGMAEMLTPVDYTQSSTVWASDKWKGVFKVRWIFVRDIPNVNLRHIKLNNTQERKPVTNSRDTQELLPDAGQEMLRIFHTHTARTSLLQDFAFYELQAMQKLQAQSGPSSPISNPGGYGSPTLQNMSPLQSGQQSPVQQQSNFFAMQGNPNALAYQMPQMTPMMQMQMMGMNMGGLGMGSMGNMGNMAGSQFPMSQTQAMHQSVMRHPSPGSGPGGQQQQQQGGNQGFINF
ncbi:YTH-domain-containing protein [Lentinula raphanica]|uniref:YTH-domain-containing protein n=1 Tax=Lentinula raphanica TaxID=153919 RepID=A0AA38PEI7_9AGAR|nr:YTH-domain-containing protein [Lentinula raphanica]